jgi:tetratricopeptide (TPR) repeat protein
MSRPLAAALLLSLLAAAGCGPSFHELRVEGQKEMLAGDWGSAQYLLEQARRKKPDHVENLHDLGVCSLVLARRQFEQRNTPAAQRELDRAEHYYDRAIAVEPGYQPAIAGKNRAQELQGQFEEALKTAHWAAQFVGPSAEQFLFLGKQYQERGDYDAAFLRYKQAVQMEPNNPKTHKAIGLLFKRVKRNDMAVKALSVSLQIDPTQQDVADALRELGEPVPAVDLGGEVPSPGQQRPPGA